MSDPNLYLTAAASGLLGLAIVTVAALAGWRGWLSLKQQELQHHFVHAQGPGVPTASARIEIADLKERIRKLEAIAAGVDL
ncbi:hypothetical protein [Sphingomonas aracearum]|uniref:Uncharacterized protein n=1 Tax=Sphingomonas aracearum TaxID=2283317 RepID=A0A369VTP6_9SPHN|nr:hypothetical protein [Sphingomonas aracearum]RDE05219.1 hypothetical protein DVW87_08065 [Sphingomonas aracearum]